MVKPLHRWLACLFLVCITATIIPSGLYHQHEESDLCDGSDVALEQDACHIRTHHPGEVKEHQCTHESHYDKQHEHCDLCQYTSPPREDYEPQETGTFITLPQLLEFPTIAETVDPQPEAQTLFKRGPPTAC